MAMCVDIAGKLTHRHRDHPMRGQLRQQRIIARRISHHHTVNARKHQALSDLCAPGCPRKHGPAAQSPVSQPRCHRPQQGTYQGVVIPTAR